MEKCILICDDDRDILEVCTTILNIQGFRVETSLTCNNIIALVETVKPDLILMDLWVPDLGGEAAVKILRENSKTAFIPILFFSANNNLENISTKAKVEGFLRKPFDLDEMEDTINRFLKAPVSAQ